MSNVNSTHREALELSVYKGRSVVTIQVTRVWMEPKVCLGSLQGTRKKVCLESLQGTEKKAGIRPPRAWNILPPLPLCLPPGL